MEITELNKYCDRTALSKKVDNKGESMEVNIADAFKNEVLNWQGKIKEKLEEDLENDQEKNIKMSEKQWHALLDKVDIAIKMQKQATETKAKADTSEAEEEKKRLHKDEIYK